MATRNGADHSPLDAGLEGYLQEDCLTRNDLAQWNRHCRENLLRALPLCTTQAGSFPAHRADRGRWVVGRAPPTYLTLHPGLRTVSIIRQPVIVVGMVLTGQPIGIQLTIPCPSVEVHSKAMVPHSCRAYYKDRNIEDGHKG